MFRRRIFKARFQVTTPVSFKLLVAASDRPETSAENVFVASGLHAAIGMQTPGRRMVLTDVAQVLSCSADALDFLFDTPVMAANDSDPVAMPDYRASLNAGRRAFAR